MKKKIVSGIQASGFLHLGNYLGAIVNWLKLQETEECIFFIADLHAITVEKSPEELNNSIYRTLATYLACGIDPKKSIIFAQSHVSAHLELAWLLGSLTPMGWLKRMTQFKTKSGKDKEIAGSGLFTYPILMAADILLYDADEVPVGSDQKQHLELTRDLAELVNKKFNYNLFKIPEPLILGKSTRVMSLKDGKIKMSKSDSSDQSRINLTDTESDIFIKIKKAKTDSLTELSYDINIRPEITNLINIYSDISGKYIEDIIRNYHNKGLSEFKDDLSKTITNLVLPISAKISDYLNNKDYLTQILKEGASKASHEGENKLSLLKKHFGFIV